MLTTPRFLFIPNAVYIPLKDGKEGRDFDRDGLHTTSGRWRVPLRRGLHRRGVEERWRTGLHPALRRLLHAHGSEISVGRLQLLPDTCIVKFPEREHWSEDVQAITTRIFGVYALNRRQHFHLCEIALLRTVVR